jgi:DNA-binding beta-propeller fold protein YncE
MRRGLRARGASIALLAASCSSGGGAASSNGAGISGTPGSVGSSIAVVGGGAHVAVVNPEQGRVSFLDPSSLAVVATTSVGGEPHALLEVMAAGTPMLLVATYRAGEIVVLDESTMAVSRHVSVCAGPYGLATSPDGTWAAISCEWDGTVQRLDLATMQTSPLATRLHRPRALAIVGGDVYVADYIGGLVHKLEGGADTTTSLVPASAPYRPALTAMTANLASAMLPAFGSLFISHVLENNTGNATLEPIAGDYGSVTSTNPKINPAVTTFGASAPVLYAQYDGGPRVYSGPSALASFGGRYLLVAHVSTANVAVIDTQGTTPDTRAVGTFDVGSGPSGIAVDAAHAVAFVDNALDQSVSRLDLAHSFAAPASVLPAPTTLVRSLPSPFSAEALAGRRLFFDATNPHVTPSGVVACASCHPGGSDDGLVWFIDTPNIPLKRRRTPHLANATTETAPFHWNGQFSTMSDLVENTMTNLMAGDGLLVDVTSIQPFIDEIVRSPVLPVTDRAAVARGQALFTGAELACAKCHPGSTLTDDMMHAVLQPMSLTSDDAFPTANTPGLRGVFLAAPYFHDGRAATLADVLTEPYAGPMVHGMSLSPGDVSDLTAFLQSL